MTRSHLKGVDADVSFHRRNELFSYVASENDERFSFHFMGTKLVTTVGHEQHFFRFIPLPRRLATQIESGELLFVLLLYLAERANGILIIPGVSLKAFYRQQVKLALFAIKRAVRGRVRKKSEK